MASQLDERAAARRIRGPQGSPIRLERAEQTNGPDGLHSIVKGDETTIEADLITLRYGTDMPPIQGRGSGSPKQLVTKGDKKRTDNEKAEYAHTGGRWGIKRPFYAVGDGDAEAVTEVCRESLDEYIKNANAQNH